MPIVCSKTGVGSDSGRRGDNVDDGGRRGGAVAVIASEVNRSFARASRRREFAKRRIMVEGLTDATGIALSCNETERRCLMAQRTSRKARFLKEHPLCCFCGGTRAATTLDHVPPRLAFRLDCGRGSPSSLPARTAITERRSTIRIFGFCSMLLDFNDDNRTLADCERLGKLRDEIARRYPEALPTQKQSDHYI
jgi:hypothetical protein